MKLDELIRKLQELRARFNGYDARVNPDPLIADILRDLRAVERDVGDEWLSLNEASLRSGYSPEHLRRLVREGRLTSERRGRRRYVRSGDLPRKPLTDGGASAGSYDATADARRITGRMVTSPEARQRGRDHAS